MKIKKAVIPVAGRGTRFLPATKEISKEIIPILNVPMIQYVVKEAIDSGIEEIIFVTSRFKPEIERYFSPNLHLERFLEEQKKFEELAIIKKIGSMIKINSVEQKEQLGLGHAVLMSEELVAGEDFAVLLADDLIFNDRPCTQQLIDCYLQNAGSVIGVMEVPKSETQKYGIVDGEFIEDQSPDNNKTLKMKKMIEKPKPELAPTNLATPGRYILKNSIFQHLKTIKRGAGGEYQLTDAINQMCQSEENVFAFIFAGKRYDTGSLKGYIEATIDMALSLDETSEFTYQILKNRIENR